MSRLRGFQASVDSAMDAAEGNVVMAVMPTGSGKTVLMGHRARKHNGYGCSIAHRSELVGQISTALGREGVRHRLIASKATIRTITQGHIETLGRSFVDQRAHWAVASIDTIIRRDENDQWFKQVTLWQGDEGHHFLRANKWGRGVSMFPNARGELYTATPTRADGMGLGSHADGVVDVMVEGPSMLWLMDQGYLTRAQIHSLKPADLDMSDVHVTASGDFNAKENARAVKRSKLIVADVVDTYITNAMGLLGITFAVDVEHAETIAAKFNARNVPAIVITADTAEEERRRILRAFRNREYLQLVNVDLFGEGFDLPAIQCVSMARPTASYSLWVQQFGRALRLMISDILATAWDSYTVEQRLKFIAESEKPFAMIFDHVGNLYTHNGPPYLRHEPWSLDGRRRRGDAEVRLDRVCPHPDCQKSYERFLTCCPFCGREPPPPINRSGPKEVDGDLTLYTDDMLQQLWGEIAHVDGPAVLPWSQPAGIQRRVLEQHNARQQAQAVLREQMAWWAGHNAQYSDREKYRKFFLTFGIDVAKAKTLGSAEAQQLTARIQETMQ